MTWNQQPLRLAVQSLAEAEQVAVLIDRRLDPGTPLTDTLRDEPMAEVLARAAETAGGAIAAADEWVYLGPPRAAREIRTLVARARQQVDRLAAAEKRRWLAAEPMEWSDFAVPRELLEAWTQEAGVTIEGLDRVPHDLLSAVSLPSLPLATRVTLLLAQFDLALAWNDDEAAVVEIARPVRIEKRYRAGSNPDATLERWQKRCPDCDIQSRAGQLIVLGRVEDHELLEAKPAPPRPPKPLTKPQPGERRYQLRLSQVPLQQVLRALEKQAGLKFEYDPDALRAAGCDLERLVTIEVRDATLAELLEQVFDGSGIEFDITAERVRLAPR